jgi:uncharacterized protein
MIVPITLTRIPGGFTIYRLPPDARVPDAPGVFRTVVRSPGETTIIQATETDPPDSVQAQSGPWALMSVVGVLPHDATGILAGLSAALADAGIPIFAISTFDTDHLLVPAGRALDAQHALADRGYALLNPE